jgi:membrane associated rhomboid family serine protease
MQMLMFQKKHYTNSIILKMNDAFLPNIFTVFCNTIMTNIQLPTWRTLPKGVQCIIIILTVLFLANWLMHYTGYSLATLLGLHYWSSARFGWWQCVTYAFCHTNVLYLFVTLAITWLLGSKLEYIFGTKLFISFCLGNIIACAIVYLFMLHYEYTHIKILANGFAIAPSAQRFHNIVTQYMSSEIFFNNYYVATNLDKSWMHDVQNNQFSFEATELIENLLWQTKNGLRTGASPIICAIVTVYGILLPKDRLYGILPIAAKYIVPILLPILVFFAAFLSAGTVIAHMAHVVGIIFGLIFAVVFKKFNRKSF